MNTKLGGTMYQTFTISAKLNQFIGILLPVLITQLSLFTMTFFDTTMSGHASPEDLAGVAIGASIWLPVNTGLTGILLGVTPIIAQLLGAGRKELIPYKLIQAIYVALLIAVLVIVIGGFSIGPILNAMPLKPAVADIAHHFLAALAIGIVPLFLYTVLRSFIDAHGLTKLTMMITLLSLPVNVVLNYLLIFGHFGFPRLGGVGAGYATAITYWVILGITLIFVRRQPVFQELRLFATWFRPALQAWKELLRIGVPIGFAIFFETAIFAAVTLLMSEFNTETIAAHQAAINFASFLYMVPLSIALGLTIVVGYEAGAKRHRDARQYSMIGIGLAVLMSLVCAALLLMFREQVAGLYTSDAAVLELTKQFLIYALFFQLSDAIAAPIQGVLRGYKDVNFTFIAAFVSYWLIGLPLGYYLAGYTSLQAYGYWIGLITGLAAGALALICRLVYVQRKHNQSSSQLNHS